MVKEKTIVLKFGGAAVAKPEMFARIATLILAQQKQYPRVVTVVSAMGDTTNALTALAKKVHPSPPRREYDMLVSVGERISISLLAMALVKQGAEAVSFTGSQSGIITCTNHSEARIVDVRPDRIRHCLEEGKIAIVAGFQGVSRDKEITTLGRGGSDTTAVALAIALGAEKVVYYKDVPGVFADDPKRNATAEHYATLSYDSALDIVQRGAKAILHPRCLHLAKRNALLLRVVSFQEEQKGTVIGLAEQRPQKAPVFEGST